MVLDQIEETSIFASLIFRRESTCLRRADYPAIHGMSTASAAFERLPTLEELRPDAQTMNEPSTVPLEYALVMQRIPGQPSYCKTIGDALGKDDPRTLRAWSDFEALPRAAYDAIAAGIVDVECRRRTPEVKERAKHFCQLLLQPAGLVLLRSVAAELHALELQNCWAWCARLRRRCLHALVGSHTHLVACAAGTRAARRAKTSSRRPSGTSSACWAVS